MLYDVYSFTFFTIVYYLYYLVAVYQPFVKLMID